MPIKITYFLCHFLSSLKIIPSLLIYMVLSLCNRGGELVWLLGNAAVGRGGGPGRGVPRASRLGTGAGTLPGTGASGCPTTRLSPDPLFGSLPPPASGQSAVGHPRLASDPAHLDAHDQAPACGPALVGCIPSYVGAGSAAANICFSRG
jgi:hypothetical protein